MWSYALAYLAAGLGAGLVTFGAGFGIGKIAAAAMDGTARQPEAGGAIRITMIIAAAMIEGIALFGVVVCFLLASIKP
ncbi:ATP synthase F0 subunit C [Caldithrix abyssi]